MGAAGTSAVTGCTTEAQACASDCQNNTACFAEPLANGKLNNVYLLSAARDGEAALVKEALQAGAYVETRQPMRMLAGEATIAREKKSGFQAYGPTPLMLAAKSGSVQCVNLLLAARAKVEAVEEDGLRPVHFAAFSGDTRILELLLDVGADPRTADEQGMSVLDHLPKEVLNEPKLLRQWKELVSAGPRCRPSVESGGDDLTVPDDDD